MISLSLSDTRHSDVHLLKEGLNIVTVVIFVVIVVVVVARTANVVDLVAFGIVYGVYDLATRS